MLPCTRCRVPSRIVLSLEEHIGSLRQEHMLCESCAVAVHTVLRHAPAVEDIDDLSLPTHAASCPCPVCDPDQVRELRRDNAA